MTDKMKIDIRGREPLPQHQGFYYNHDCPGIECWCNDEVVTPYRPERISTTELALAVGHSMVLASYQLDNRSDTLQCEDCGETFSSDSLGLRLLDLHRCGKV